MLLDCALQAVPSVPPGNRCEPIRLHGPIPATSFQPIVKDSGPVAWPNKMSRVERSAGCQWLGRVRRHALRAPILGAFSWTLVVIASCDTTPSGVREWRASDHDRADEVPGVRTQGRSTASPSVAAAPSDSMSAKASQIDGLVDLAWRTQCATCHGLSGHGDGPQGAFVHPPDLTRPDVQAKVTDEQLGKVILNGRNRMPKFDLPAEVVAGLVKRIRFLKARD